MCQRIFGLSIVLTASFAVFQYFHEDETIVQPAEVQINHNQRPFGYHIQIDRSNEGMFIGGCHYPSEPFILPPEMEKPGPSDDDPGKH